MFLAGLAVGAEVTVCNSYTGHVLNRIKDAFNKGDMKTARMWQVGSSSLSEIRPLITYRYWKWSLTNF